MQPHDKHTTWGKSWNYLNFLLESPLNFLNLDFGKMCEPCNSFLAKVRESQGIWVPKSQGKSGNFAEKNWVDTLVLQLKDPAEIQKCGYVKNKTSFLVRTNKRYVMICNDISIRKIIYNRSCNQSDNIWDIYLFTFTTSEADLNYYCKKLNIWIFIWVTKQDLLDVILYPDQ